MFTLICWIILSILSYLVGKIAIENATKPVGGVVPIMRHWNATDAETSDDDKSVMENCPDNVISAVFWTFVLVLSLIAWPLLLCIVSYNYVKPVNASTLEDWE